MGRRNIQAVQSRHLDVPGRHPNVQRGRPWKWPCTSAWQEQDLGTASDNCVTSRLVVICPLVSCAHSTSKLGCRNIMCAQKIGELKLRKFSSEWFFFLPPCTLISWTFAKIKCRELLWQNTEPFEVRSSSVMRAASGRHFQKWWLYDCAVFAMVSASLGHTMFSGHTMMLLQS